MKDSKKNMGITLIALVITIIVLLILSGIVIGTLNGNNGIIENTNKAKRDTEISDWEEKIEIAIVKTEGAKNNPTMDDIIEELIEDEIISDSSKVNMETGAITTNEPSYIIEGKLDDYIKGITADMIANSEDKSEYYGAELKGYTTADETKAKVEKWQIFYADKNNIYIISSDYIDIQYIPYSTKKDENGNRVVTDNKPDGGSYYPRGASLSNILVDYKGTDDIEERLKKWNDSYFSKGYTSTNNNMKAVAYMLDTVAWKDFAGDNAEYAIGGPTLELLFKSHNEKYGTKYIAEATSVIGYQIKKQENDTWNDYVFGMIKKDNLYIGPSNINAYALRIASPSASGVNVVYRIDGNGHVNIDNYSGNNAGFRPIVCLKNNIGLEKKVDESGNVYYTIKE